MNNKGQLFDIAVIFMIVLALAIVLPIGYLVMTSVNNGLANAPFVGNANQTENINSVTTQSTGVLTRFDNIIFPLLIVVMIIGLVITSFFIPSHPIFLIINIIGVVFLVFLGIILGYVHEQFINGNAGVLSASLPFVGVGYAMRILPWLGVVVIFITSIVGVAKGNN